MIKKTFHSDNSNRKIVRFEKNFQKEISEIILKEIKDPGINALTSVLDVKMSKDNSVAFVKIRIFGSDKKDIVKTLDALRRSAGYISSIVGSNLSLRRSPEIRFEPVKDDEYTSVWLNKDSID